MTVHAREVLRDCERLLDVIRPDMPTELWRPRWAGLVALLRAVGHVLRYVDGKESDAAGKVIRSRWDDLLKSKPEPTIFWEFIYRKRNNVVKTYAFGAGVNINITPGGQTTFEAFMRSGPYQGRNPLELCREAIAFWHRYLDAIDEQVAEISASIPKTQK